MKRVLLIYENYETLLKVETALKKAGYEVLTLTQEAQLAEQILSFDPDFVIACGGSAHVSTLRVGQKLSEFKQWQGQSLLLFLSQSPPTPEDLLQIRMDLMLEAPVEPSKLLQVLKQLSSEDKAPQSQLKNQATSIYVQGGKSKGPVAEPVSSSDFADVDLDLLMQEVQGGAPSLEPSVKSPVKKNVDRQKKYDEWLKKHPTQPEIKLSESTVRRKEAKSRWHEQKDRMDNKKNSEIDSLRRGFVKELFLKKWRSN